MEKPKNEFYFTTLAKKEAFCIWKLSFFHDSLSLSLRCSWNPCTGFRVTFLCVVFLILLLLLPSTAVLSRLNGFSFVIVVYIIKERKEKEKEVGRCIV